MKFFLSLCLLAFPLTIRGQQAIVNLPSADITPKNAFFSMHETQARFNRPNRYWYATNFFAYGIGKNTELAVTSYNHGYPATANASFGIGFKSAIPFRQKSDAKREYKWTIGQMAIISSEGRGLGTFVYSHGSFRLPALNTRLTAGISAGTKELFKKNTAHFIGGIEQPLDKKNRFVFLTEWFSGKHDFGFVTPGLLYHPAKRIILVAAYKFPNYTENGKSAFIGEIGFILGGKKENQNDNKNPIN